MAIASEFSRVPLTQVRYAQATNELGHLSPIAAAAPGPQSRHELDYSNRMNASITSVVSHSSHTYSL
jgi:hypothetical protein